ncbi:gag/pol protein [Gossypium australe]|uniref:Gag/pol protein n=1 Tax=Gossypium australe TaxID=47621 RepID=A0A5B6V0S3_9ROSI|nr:gag/pol protein [Gossypium australe]
MVRLMLSYSKLSISFCGYVLQMTCYILNDVPTKATSKTPYGLWHDRKLNLNHLKIWGCSIHVLDKYVRKLDSWTKLRMFVGYPKGKNGGLFYNLKEQKR